MKEIITIFFNCLLNQLRDITSDLSYTINFHPNFNKNSALLSFSMAPHIVTSDTSVVNCIEKSIKID